jgi:DNA-binding transcriptional ArsR family regulator
MTGGSSGSSEQVVRILAQLTIHGPLRVEELQKRCANMSKRTFYLALKEAEESGLLVRVRKSRKNVLVQLNPRKPEIGKGIKAYDHERKQLGLYYTPESETIFHGSLLAAIESRNRKEFTRLIFNQAWRVAIASVMSILLEANLDDPVMNVQKEIDNLLLQRHKQMVHDCIKKYGSDAKAALEAWVAKQAKEIAPQISAHR